MNRFYYICSLLFHPLWIPTWVLIVWFNEFLSDRFGFFSSTFGIFLGYEVGFVVVIPLLVFLSTRLGRKTDFEMEDVSSRVWPFLIGGIFWLGYTLNLKDQLGPMADLIWLTTGSGGVLLICLAFFYFKKIKISAHASGWAILLPILVFNHTLPLELRLGLTISIILIGGFVTGIRWISGAHRWDELLIGHLLGLFISTSFIQIITLS